MRGPPGVDPPEKRGLGLGDLLGIGLREARPHDPPRLGVPRRHEGKGGDGHQRPERSNGSFQPGVSHP